MESNKVTETLAKAHYCAIFKNYCNKRIKQVKNKNIKSMPTKYGIDNIIKSIINKPESNKDEWLIITFHEISKTPSIYGVTEEDFLRIIKVVHNGIIKGTHKNITVYEGYKLFEK